MRTVGLITTASAAGSGEKSFEKLTKGELEALAAAEDIDISSASNQDERRALIVAARECRATASAAGSGESQD